MIYSFVWKFVWKKGDKIEKENAIKKKEAFGKLVRRLSFGTGII